MTTFNSANILAGTTIKNSFMDFHTRSPLMAKIGPDFSKMFPDFNKMLGPLYEDATKNVAATIAESFKPMLNPGLEKIFAQAANTSIMARQVTAAHTDLMKQLYPSLNVAKIMGIDSELQKSIQAMASAVTGSIDASFANTLLEKSYSLRDELAEQDADTLADEFFEAQPELAESIEQLPFLFNFTSSERHQIVWFVRITVALYVTCLILNVSLESPEMAAAIGALGVSGPAAGAVAGKATRKILDKLPLDSDAAGDDPSTEGHPGD